MKKIFLILITLFIITGCNSKEKEEVNKVINNKYLSATLNEESNVIINTDEITDEATFINYVYDGVTIQLIAVRASDGTVRIVLNTCQACNPDKNAYFIQEGEYVVCQTCGTKIKIDDIGFKSSGCKPIYIPDEYKDNIDKNIIINKQYLNKYKERFETWNGKIA